MPIRMDISPIDRLVVIVARGPVSPEEIAEKTTTLVAANVPGYAKIIDVTGSSSASPPCFAAGRRRRRAVPSPSW